jgi:hypothetical protein
MDGLTLLRRARDAGLRVEADDGKLLIRGPKRAEPVVKLLARHKTEVLAALVPKGAPEMDVDEAHWWRDWLGVRIVEWFHDGRGWEEAARLAWGDALNEWHQRHGKRWPSWQCAGCEAPISGIRAFTFPDGNRVHDTLNCVIAFGNRWRGAACTALVALGLERPAET